MQANEISTSDGRPHFDTLLGAEYLSDEPEDTRVRVAVRDELLQPFGIVHGGVYSALIESVCSRATALIVFGEGNVAMGQSINVSFLRPIGPEGHVEARARVRHRGRTTWVWEAEILDSEERVCALAQMTIAVRPNPAAKS